MGDRILSLTCGTRSLKFMSDIDDWLELMVQRYSTNTILSYYKYLLQIIWNTFGYGYVSTVIHLYPISVCKIFREHPMHMITYDICSILNQNNFYIMLQIIWCHIMFSSLFSLIYKEILSF